MNTQQPGQGINTLGKRIAPGFWEDADGNPHVSITELLALVELEDTPENHEIVKQMLVSMVKEKHPDKPVIFRTTPDDKGTVIN